MNFFRTLRVFSRNRFVPWPVAAWRHCLWQVRKLRGGFPCEVDFDGLRLGIPTRAVADGCGALVNALGLYDPNNMRLLDELFRRGVFTTAFDVGAYAGAYSMLAGRHAGSRVRSFEPHPATFALLESNLRLNREAGRLAGEIEATHAALSAADGSVRFADGAGSVYNRVVGADEPADGTVLVPALSGATACEQFGAAPEVIKIDTEGHEASVLHSFGPRLGEIALVIVECLEPATIAPLLAAHGFSGPLKTDYRGRALRSDFASDEDWVFVNRAGRERLAAAGFSAA